MHLNYREKSPENINEYKCPSLISVISFIVVSFFIVSNALASSEMNYEKLLKDLKDNKVLIDAQNERIEQIEEMIEEMDEQVGSRALAHAFEAKELTVGGFLHSTFTSIEGEDGSASSFNRLIFELLVRAKFNEDWSAFAAQAFIRESDDAFGNPFNASASRTDPAFNQRSKAPLVIAWVNYQNSDLLNIQLGRYITPHGIINIEHFPATLLDTEQPLFLRPFSGNTLFPNFMTGVNMHGRKFVGTNQESILSYNLFTGNFAGNPGELVTGGRVSYEFGKSGFTVGGNASTGDRGVANSDYNLVGIDVLIKKGKFLWKSEVFSSSEDFGEDRLGWYVQPGWHVTPKWTIFYRYDFLDNGRNSDQTENMLGINHLPYPNIRLRATLTAKDFDVSTAIPSPATDATVLQFSGTFSF
ncbi:MAG: hypothetical protein COB30_016900 [Ectothiorhodospiraceae bacterium]|nr:hypothetical protein [Ectothiorhodospiraceae bacterium]